MEVLNMTKYTEPTFKAINVKGEDILTNSTPFDEFEAGTGSLGGITEEIVGDTIVISG